MQYTTDFHSNLVGRRKELGLTQEQLAQRLNVSPQAVSKWERSSYPDAELLPRLAAALNISLDTLYGLGSADSGADPVEAVSQTLQSLPPERRPEFVAKLGYAVICAYNPSTDGVTGRLRGSYEHETFAKLHTDHEIALARLNSDQRYFMYLEKPEHGIADYLRSDERIVLLLRTLADTDAIRLVKYMAGNCRNMLFMSEKLAERLDIPLEKVQRIMDRLDRFGLVWRMSGDFGTEADAAILYGYTHNPAVAMMLVLAQSACNYLRFSDPEVALFTYGTMQDRSSGDPKRIPQVSTWDADRAVMQSDYDKKG